MTATLAPSVPLANWLETYERFDHLYDSYMAARSAHFDRYAAGELSAEQVDDLDREARRPLLETLSSAGVQISIYLHDRQARDLQARIRENRGQAIAAVAERECARIQSAVETTVRFAEVCKELGVSTLAEARAALEAEIAALEERAGRGCV